MALQQRSACTCTRRWLPPSSRLISDDIPASRSSVRLQVSQPARGAFSSRLRQRPSARSRSVFSGRRKCGSLRPVISLSKSMQSRPDSSIIQPAGSPFERGAWFVATARHQRPPPARRFVLPSGPSTARPSNGCDPLGGSLPFSHAPPITAAHLALNWLPLCLRPELSKSSNCLAFLASATE